MDSIPQWQANALDRLVAAGRTRDVERRAHNVHHANYCSSSVQAMASVN